jgi:hypothetical protein
MERVVTWLVPTFILSVALFWYLKRRGHTQGAILREIVIAVVAMGTAAVVVDRIIDLIFSLRRTDAVTFSDIPLAYQLSMVCLLLLVWAMLASGITTFIHFCLRQKNEKPPT